MTVIHEDVFRRSATRKKTNRSRINHLSGLIVFDHGPGLLIWRNSSLVIEPPAIINNLSPCDIFIVYADIHVIMYDAIT